MEKLWISVHQKTTMTTFRLLGMNSGDEVPDNFTVMSWIKPRSDGQNNQGRILDADAGNNGGPFTFQLYGTKPTLQIYDGTDWDLWDTDDSGIINWEQWQHAAVTFESGTATFFVDGIEYAASRSGSGSQIYGNLDDTSGNVNIGKRPSDNQRDFDGAIDEVKYYDYIRTKTRSLRT